jgi:CRISPR-associated helicase Cas3/CRISPR-associated endonuclease Cas3-HD
MNGHGRVVEGALVGVGLGARVSRETRTAWAKFYADSEMWLPLWQHMEDSAAVAAVLWDRWLAPHVRRLIAQSVAGSEGDARRLVVWLAGVHDIGKLTPAFAFQVEGLANRMRAVGLEMSFKEAMGDGRRLAPHGLAGQVLLQEWLEEVHGWGVVSAQQLAAVVGGHHGTPPDDAQIHALARHPGVLRTPGRSEALWRGCQRELLDACAVHFGVLERISDWGGLEFPQTVQVLLSGLVIVADWIASNQDLFPYVSQAGPSGGGGGVDRVALAWDVLDLPEPWRAPEPTETVRDLFSGRFELPPGAELRPVQELAFREAQDASAPGLMIIEAPMGEGKTEAALAVAEVWGARSGAGGVFFALPTMATGNAMFSRVLSWLGALPAQGEDWSVFLAHSKSALNEEYAGLRSRRDRAAWRLAGVEVDGDEVVPGPGRDGPVPAVLVAHHWLAGRKKGMLSSFAVGTIDQLLFAGLKSRHLVMRHLAVAGKVVIIDEAHAYDAYMNTYLERVLAWLGGYRVPVVVLSATLPAARRSELAAAYAGARARMPEFAALRERLDYPLVTTVVAGQAPVCRRAEVSSRSTEVEVEGVDDDPEVLAERLWQELAGGGCVLVIRNTVKRVIETARVLRERFDAAEVTVAHARFVDLDRLAKDKRLLDMFGPPDRPGVDRPRRHIVVASQVAEQSLDVDFDLLVTDLAPVDLLLQRMGRLHRHQRGPRPEQLQRARCLITGVDWAASPPAPVRGSVAVYGLYVLLRSLAVLGPHLTGSREPLRLPAAISPLVQRAYGDEEVGPQPWAEAIGRARDAHQAKIMKQRRDADAFRIAPPGRAGSSLVGWLSAGVGDADDTRAGRAQVRDGRESLEVIVVQQDEDGSWSTLGWLDKGRGGLPLPRTALPTIAAAKAAAGCALRLPWEFTNERVIDKVIAELEALVVDAWQTKESTWLARELILPLGKDCRTRLAGFLLTYSREDGLEVTSVD